VAVEAGRQLAEDRKAGAFELLLSTPLRVREIVGGQWLALRRQLLWPSLVVVLLEVLFLIGSARVSPRGYGMPAGDEPAVVFTWAAGIVMLVADVIALGWVATWAGLTARSANHATISATLRILVLPWILHWGVAAAAEFSAHAAGVPTPSWNFYVGLWLVLGLATDLVFGVIAWHRLGTRFRDAASLRYAPGERRLFGLRLSG